MLFSKLICFFFQVLLIKEVLLKKIVWKRENQEIKKRCVVHSRVGYLEELRHRQDLETRESNFLRNQGVLGYQEGEARKSRGVRKLGVSTKSEISGSGEILTGGRWDARGKGVTILCTIFPLVIIILSYHFIIITMRIMIIITKRTMIIIMIIMMIQVRCPARARPWFSLSLSSSTFLLARR